MKGSTNEEGLVRRNIQMVMQMQQGSGQPAGSCGVSIACPGVLLRIRWMGLSIPLLSLSSLWPRTAEAGAATPHTWHQILPFGGDLSSASHLYHTVL